MIDNSFLSVSKIKKLRNKNSRYGISEPMPLVKLTKTGLNAKREKTTISSRVFMNLPRILTSITREIAANITLAARKYRMLYPMVLIIRERIKGYPGGTDVWGNGLDRKLST